ncbi:MAG: hypothetical protein JWQ71_1066 [Pedosphaera sp.]|nr:hypothetical protein [Pedosphaera sp.]
MKKIILIGVFAAFVAIPFISKACVYIDPNNTNITYIYPCDPTWNGTTWQQYDCGQGFTNEQGLYDCAYVKTCCPI